MGVIYEEGSDYNDPGKIEQHMEMQNFEAD